MTENKVGSIIIASSDPDELVMQFTEAAVQRGSGSPTSVRQEFDQQSLEEIVAGFREDLNFLRRFGAVLSSILRP